jgi:hypothetical protein
VPDITMCADHDCPMAKQCYRHEATPSDRQPWFAGSPRIGGTPRFPLGSCDMFLPSHGGAWGELRKAVGAGDA